jgi:hypothetical protein
MDAYAEYRVKAISKSDNLKKPLAHIPPEARKRSVFLYSLFSGTGIHLTSKKESDT